MVLSGRRRASSFWAWEMRPSTNSVLYWLATMATERRDWNWRDAKELALDMDCLSKKNCAGGGLRGALIDGEGAGSTGISRGGRGWAGGERVRRFRRAAQIVGGGNKALDLRRR